MSKSPRLVSLLACVNRNNVEFMHNSARAGLHVVPDALSRMPRKCKSADCQVERFLQDLPSQPLLMAMATEEDLVFGDTRLAATTNTTELLQQLTRGRGSIPLGSANTWRDIQISSFICRQFIEQKRMGKLPDKRAKDRRIQTEMHRRCAVVDGLIVVHNFNPLLQRQGPDLGAR